MSDLFGNHIVGFPTRLIYIDSCLQQLRGIPAFRVYENKDSELFFPLEIASDLYLCFCIFMNLILV